MSFLSPVIVFFCLSLRGIIRKLSWFAKCSSLWDNEENEFFWWKWVKGTEILKFSIFAIYTQFWCSFFIIFCDKGFRQYSGWFLLSIMVFKLNLVVIQLVKEKTLSTYCGRKSYHTAHSSLFILEGIMYCVGDIHRLLL